jgi:DNA invertase Pin-like site-specific DNA recombinase
MIYGYARVSTDEQSESITEQVQRLTAFMSTSGYDQGEVFVDEGWSASKYWMRDRPNGKRLLDALSSGDIVVYTSQDRLFRDVADQELTMRCWKAIGVRAYDLAKGRFATTVEDGLLDNMEAVFNQYFSRKLAKRVKDAWAIRKERGEPYTTMRPVGWIRKDKAYVPCPAERTLGDRADAMQRDGMSYEAITLAFAREGVRKPTFRKGASGYYSLEDVYYLVRAARAGYPAMSKRSLPNAPTSDSRSAKESGGLRQSSAASAPSRTDQ